MSFMYEMPSEELMAFVTTIKSYDLLKCCDIIHAVMNLLSCILLPTTREGNVLTGVCHSVHNRPHGYLVIAHSCHSAVGTHPIGMLSCSIVVVVFFFFNSNIFVKRIPAKVTVHSLSFPNT